MTTKNTNTAKSPRSNFEDQNRYITNLTALLLEKTGSVHGRLSGKMSADEQRELFGRYIGKGTIVVDGMREVVYNQVKIAFGMDWDDRNVTRWIDL